MKSRVLQILYVRPFVISNLCSVTSVAVQVILRMRTALHCGGGGSGNDVSTCTHIMSGCAVQMREEAGTVNNALVWFGTASGGLGSCKWTTDYLLVGKTADIGMTSAVELNAMRRERGSYVYWKEPQVDDWWDVRLAFPNKAAVDAAHSLFTFLFMLESFLWWEFLNT